jgi:hypothetical protein
LWTRRSVRSSSGGSTTDARVERKWAGEGAKRRGLQGGSGGIGPDGSNVVYINMR